MAEAITLTDLMDIPGVLGAVRWKEAVVGKAGAATAVLVEHLGFESEDRARQFMCAADAYGLGIKGVAQLNYEFRPDFRQNVSPIDGFYIHGYKVSMLATWNRVGVLLDNATDVDVQGLPRRLVMVRND